MIRRDTCLLAAAIAGILGLSCSDAPQPQSAAETRATTNATQASEARAGESPAATPLQGLWSGSWGGGGDGEVVMQPVLAEMVVLGDTIEWRGFRTPDSLVGTVEIDSKRGRLRAAPTAEGDAAAEAVEFGYELTGDDLTLTDADGVAILLRREPFVRDPPVANAEVSLVAARIDEAGQLVTTEFNTLLVGRGNDVYYAPRSLTLIVEQVLLVEEGGLKQISLDEARGLMRETTPVAVTFRESGLEYEESSLWEMQAGPPAPDSDAVERTLLRTLRPGILVFILPASQLRPPP